jgi:hypothetical protein
MISEPANRTHRPALASYQKWSEQMNMIIGLIIAMGMAFVVITARRKI